MQNPLRFIAVRPSFFVAFATALVAALFFPSAAAYFLPAALASESVVVTGARIPAPLERFDGAATVITARDIRSHQYRSLGDALASVPGLHVSSPGGASAQTSVFIRGAESNHVLVLIDGVEASDPGSGLFAFEHLQLNDVERIEVLRGPYGAQYGSESIGGVINVVTRRGQGAPRASARIETGSLETNAAAVNLSGRSERVDFSLGGAWFETGGESFTPRRLRAGGDEERDGERDGYGNLDVKGAFGVEFDGRSRVDLSFGYTDANTEYDGFSRPFEQSGLEDSTRERRYSARWSGAAGAWRPLLRVGRYERDYAASGGYSTRAERTQFEWRNDFSWSQQLQFTAGAETELEEFDRHSARTDAVYLQARYAPSDALSLSAAWRNDDPDDFGSDRNWRVAAVYIQELAAESSQGLAMKSGETRWRAAYGTAFKAPTLFDRFDPLYGNPDLDSETARSWEAGVEQTFPLGSEFDPDSGPEFGWGATYFNNRIRDLIEFDLATSLPANVASARIEGVESFVSFRPVADVSLRLDYTWMRARDGERRRLLRRPIRKASLQAGWEHASAWSFAATLDYVGPRRDVTRDTFVRTTQGGYVLAHFAARRRLGEDLTFFAKADNLFDRDYEPVDGYAGVGTALRVGLETRF